MSSSDSSSSSGNSSPSPDSSPPSPPSPPTAPANDSTAPPPENSSPDPPPTNDSPSDDDSSSSSSTSSSALPPTSPGDGSPSSRKTSPKPTKGSSPSKLTDSKAILPSSSSSSSNGAKALHSTAASTSSADSSSKSDGSVSLIVGIATGIVLVVILLAVACVCCSKKKKRKPRHQIQYYANDVSGYKDSNYYGNGPSSEWHNGHQVTTDQLGHKGWHPPPNGMSPNYSGPHGAALPPPSPAIAIGFNKSTFTYEELASATNGFSQANLLGQGGFGYVYKGILPNGKEVAVKQLKSGSGQGEREFHAEVDIISRVHHRHLVSLVGYCIAGAQRMLVYEFVPNKTLEFHLHGRGLPVMDFSTRLKIALGSAKGLAYLHEDCHPRIIHRDIKSANILLDFKFEAMVADFGLAKLTSDNHTHVSTRVMGTFGYLAPEYASSGKLTEKSDVFSYGVMLLELITGRRPVDSSHSFMEDSLVDWARPVLSRALADGNYDELADPRLNGNYDPMEMARMVACAAASVRHSARRRPKTSQIVRALEGDVSLEDLNEGMRPGQSMMFSSGSDYESSSYTKNMNRIRKVQMVDPAEYSGEYSGQLSDHHYGHHRSASSCSDDDDLSGELDPIDELTHVDQRHRPAR